MNQTRSKYFQTRKFLLSGARVISAVLLSFEVASGGWNYVSGQVLTPSGRRETSILFLQGIRNFADFIDFSKWGSAS